VKGLPISGYMRQRDKASLIRDETFRAINLIVVLLVVAAFMLLATDAYALGAVNPACNVAIVNTSALASGKVVGGAGNNPICNLLGNLNAIITGKTGKAIATVALTALGIAALFGKITWTQATIVVVGVALLFGAASIMGSVGVGEGATLDFTDPFADADPISAVLNVLAITMSGEGGRAVGVIAVVILGMGALFGKISWVQAMTLITGIAMVFGAFTIVNELVFEDAPVITAMYFTSSTGHAIINDPVGEPFMQIITLMTSELGISIATAIVMAMGFAAMLGKLSWPRALMLSAGIATMFGAADIVYILSGPLSLCATNISDPFTQVVCGFMEELQSPMGKTIGTLGVMVLGILAMLGKVSWELAFVVIIGIALVFGAQQIVNMFETSIAGVSCNSAAPTPPSTGNAIADVLCYIVMILYGPAGKALATIAVVMMGFGALMGKVSFTQAFIVAVGIAVTFGAPQIVTILMPSATISGCAVQNTFLMTLSNVVALATGSCI